MDSVAFPPQRTYDFFRVFTLFLLFFVTSMSSMSCHVRQNGYHQTGGEFKHVAQKNQREKRGT